MKFGLSNENYRILEDLLIKPLKKIDCKLWVFGSRARGDNRPHSDIDILFESSESVPKSLLFDIKTSLEDSDITIKVDLVDVNDLAESYRDSVMRDRVLL